MNKFLIAALALPLISGLSLAQTSTTSPGASANASTWTGLLVAAGCKGGLADKTTADGPMPRATTTPAREQNSTYEDRAKKADRSSSGGSSSTGDRMARRTDRGASVNEATPAVTDTVTTPPVDDKGTRGSATKNTPSTGVKDVKDQPGGTDRSCYIGQSTTAFALQLKDGRMLRFDDAGNAKIANQLQSSDRLHDKVKTFRATVKGTMKGDTISVDSIQM